MNKIYLLLSSTIQCMSQLVEFPLEDGGSILVEVTVPESESQIIKVGRADNLPLRAASTFEAALDSIRPIASAIISKLNHISNPPDEIGVEFGLSMKAEGNAILTKVGTDANLKVNLSWKKEK